LHRAEWLRENRLLKLLSGLLTPSRREILFRGPWLDGPRGGIGMAFQDPLLLPRRNVIDNMLLPIKILHLARGRFKKAIDLLVIVGLQGFERKASWQLSGGMR
jgi:NitT/TauT family transport system ATP-binding protein